MKFRKVELRMAIRNALRDTAHSQTVVSNTTQPSKMEELLKDLNYIKNTMTSVSTEGAMIQDVNDEYKQTYRKVSTELKRLGLKNPNPYSDLWEWYGKWSSGEMPQYKDRRAYLIEMFKSLFNQIENHGVDAELEIELEGWDRIERSVGEIRLRLADGETEEQLQAVGLLCRETIISLAQEVYDSEKHPPLDDVVPSATDAKRMLTHISLLNYKVLKIKD